MRHVRGGSSRKVAVSFIAWCPHMISRRLLGLFHFVSLAANGLATRGLNLLAWHARILEIRLDRVRSLAIAPVTDIDYPRVDLARIEDPVPTILNNPNFRQTDEYFARGPTSSRSLVSARTQALLYCVVRNLRPAHVVEIGVYKASTTEAIARALNASGGGTIHAVDPFRSEYIAAIFKQWPPELLERLKFHPINSVEFFAMIEKWRIRPSLVFVDGNHEYEFAYFDICRAARDLAPRGFIFIDNVSQPGPFLAARDFLANNAEWIECGGLTAAYDQSRAYDPHRSLIQGTDLMVLRAPQHQQIWHRPWSPGETYLKKGYAGGARLRLHRPSGPGTLSMQIVLRGFGPQPSELSGSASVQISTATDEITITLEQPIETRGVFSHFRAEPWFVWQAETPLLLSEAPVVF
jgi:predicted O-methyltransferase YrrM